MATTLKEPAWKRLISRIKDGNCTPFIGAGACAGVLPVGPHMAQEWAELHEYPFIDSSNLARVMQYVAVKNGDPRYIKELLIRRHFLSPSAPDFQQPDEPHSLLAEFPLRVYITTNYDDFMVQALRHHNRAAQVAICPWYTRDLRQMQETNRIFEQPSGFNPSPANPIVYYLHGSKSEPESLVLTEYDYLEFLVRIVRDHGSRTSHDNGAELLPPIIRRALGSQMLLFIGYSLQDWTFQVLFRGLLESVPPGNQLSHVSVQLLPLPEETNEEVRVSVQEYLTAYYQLSRIEIFWGSAQEFCRELRQRWEARSDDE